MGMQDGHKPVLVEQILELLAPEPGMVYLDCTLGLAGHAKLLGERISPGGEVIGLDMDPGNLAAAWENLAGAAVPCRFIQGNFSDLQSLDVGKVDLLLADLGFSSNQMADAGRGLTFSEDGPLDMRLDPSLGQKASDLVNELPEKELADLIYQYGEERLSRKIARKIVDQRVREPILTTGSLAALVRRVYGTSARGQRIDPATRTFMALRIAVNGELQALERLLESLPHVLKPGARAGIISFHSLEDRLVKQAMVRWDKEGLGHRLTKKPIVANMSQRRENPRSRSAKLRVMQWIGHRA
jgi:16S rRNA (cytosine1402-N4)-methyltransferase